MRLKKLQICGFKSFPEKTSIEFPEGISAIVGPNGCGKSNIVDAICWVTGEQSVKQLRGKSMEDVIFAGGGNRAATNMAEVSITFANENHTAPEEYRDYSEIMVTRRLYRSGESGYYINRRPCRLKDIQHLLLGSGVGARTYAVIQQGNIGAITEAGPDELRQFIEEAAGVTRYKARKKEAQQKINSTKQNLLRVMDIVAEVERTMASVKRQAQKARRYASYKQLIQALEVSLAAYEFDRYTGQINQARNQRQQIQDQDLSFAAKLSALDAEIQRISTEDSNLAGRIQRIAYEHGEMVRKMDRLENDRKHQDAEKTRLEEESQRLAKEKTELADRVAELDADLVKTTTEHEETGRKLARAQAEMAREEESSADIRESLAEMNRDLMAKKTRYMEQVNDQARYKSSVQSLSANKAQIARQRRQKAEEVLTAEQRLVRIKADSENAEAELNQVKTTRQELEKQVAETEGVLEQKRDELRQSIARAQNAELSHSRVKSRLSDLKKMEKSYQWFADGVKSLMKMRDQGELSIEDMAGLVAEVIEPEQNYEEAVETALGPALQYVLVKDTETGLHAIDHLAQTSGGRAGIIPMVRAWESPSQETKPPGEHSLLRHVNVKPGFESVVDRLLSGVLVAPDREGALAIKAERKNGCTVVTQDGSFSVGPLAMAGGGSQNAGPGILAQKSQIRELEKSLEDLAADLETARSLQKSLEFTVRELETGLQKSIAGVREMANRETDAHREAIRLAEQKKNAQRHLEIVGLEQDRLLGEEDDAEQELEKYQRLTSEVEAEVEKAKLAMDEAEKEIARQNGRLEAFSEKVTDLKVSITGLQARLDNLSSTAKRLNQYKQEMSRRLERTQYDIQNKKQEARRTGEKLEQAGREIEAGYEHLRAQEEKLGTSRSQKGEMETLLEKTRSARNAVADDRKNAAETLRDLELAQTQKELRLETIQSRIQERFGKELAELRKSEGLPKIESDEGAEEAASELEIIQGKAARLGDVNLGAIAEYEALTERHEFLISQKDDLVRAIEDLERVIRKINRYTQARFNETLALVNQKLSEVFPRLFSGGSARLELADPNTPLESGVTYLLHPPGKKVTRMTLLSGGEKALAALSFVFAIFLIKPAAFCLMDEVDAPLDDANVRRFTDLVKLIGERSQIVMITHNKSAMEFADVLFGITMEKKGISKVVSVNLERDSSGPDKQPDNSELAA